MSFLKTEKEAIEQNRPRPVNPLQLPDGREIRAPPTLDDSVNVELPDGRVVGSPFVDGEKPDVMSVRRGPYTAHVLIEESDDGVRAIPPIHIEQHRPAVFDPEKFFDFGEPITRGASNTEELKQVL